MKLKRRDMFVRVEPEFEPRIMCRRRMTNFEDAFEDSNKQTTEDENRKKIP